jgi:legumain
VIAAGSAGFMNYRHQADACHAYHQMLKSGVPAKNIILMMQDDVANSHENPFPGKLYNKPGTDSVDVYEGCKVDYRGDVVTAKLFLSVITGDESGVPASGKVLKSTNQDRVFLNFVDHGGVGIIAFPNGPTLHAKDLVHALGQMKQKNMYKELLFYMEACESGSMFPGLPVDDKIFAVTAANAKESSWGYYCPKDDMVRGKHIGSCLGDLFSIAWMEDSDRGAYQTETIKDQVQRVTKRTNKSHVTTFGDTSIESEHFGNFELLNAAPPSDMPFDEASAVEVREIPLVIARYKYKHANSPTEKAEASKELKSVLAARKADDEVFGNIVQRLCGNSKDCVDELQQKRFDMVDVDCHQELVNKVHESCPRRVAYVPGGWNDYNMKFSQLLVNACERRGEFEEHDVAFLSKLVKEECAISAASWKSSASAEIVV